MDDDQMWEQQRMEEERYKLLLRAFAELLRKNVSDETLNTLKFETGISAEDLENAHAMDGTRRY